ncbi:MAG: hypothetical protein FD129_159, partial [bacterium]
GLAEKISAVQHEVISLEKLPAGERDFAKVKELLQVFRLPDHLEIPTDDEEEDETGETPAATGEQTVA